MNKFNKFNAVANKNFYANSVGCTSAYWRTSKYFDLDTIYVKTYST